MTIIPENEQLLKHLFDLLRAHRGVFKQERAEAKAAWRKASSKASFSAQSGGVGGGGHAEW